MPLPREEERRGRGKGGRGKGGGGKIATHENFNENAVVIYNDDNVVKYDTVKVKERAGGGGNMEDTSVDKWWERGGGECRV